MFIERFKKLPLMGIIRGVDPDIVEPLVETVIESGLETLEITMNTACAPEMIKKAKALAGDNLSIGAGTVISYEDLNSALDAGSEFIVAPNIIPSIIETCRSRKIPVFPGALTPNEIFAAWQVGAAMVKVFPSSVFGPKYFKDIKGPFNKIELMAVGGVRLENIPEYFSCGASAVAFGASVFKKEWLENKDFKAIGNLIKEYVNIVKYSVGEGL